MFIIGERFIYLPEILSFSSSLHRERRHVHDLPAHYDIALHRYVVLRCRRFQVAYVARDLLQLRSPHVFLCRKCPAQHMCPCYAGAHPDIAVELVDQVADITRIRRFVASVYEDIGSRRCVPGLLVDQLQETR